MYVYFSMPNFFQAVLHSFHYNASLCVLHVAEYSQSDVAAHHLFCLYKEYVHLVLQPAITEFGCLLYLICNYVPNLWNVSYSRICCNILQTERSFLDASLLSLQTYVPTIVATDGSSPNVYYCVHFSSP